MSDFSDRHLDSVIRAQGMLVALIGTLLERRGGVAPGEFSELLGLMSAVTAETDVEAGDILAVWTRFADEHGQVTAPCRMHS
jgi:hypothetical protein